jgi:hypothetical protein
MTRTEGQRRSDEVWERLKAGLVRVVTTETVGRVPAGSVFYVLPAFAEMAL